MKKLTLTLISASLVISSPSYALFGLSEENTDVVTKLASQAQSSSELVNSLKNQLGVSTEQAAGGAGALLAMASNELSGSTGEEFSGLSSNLSGILDSAKSASNTLDSMAAVKSVFEKLGLDSSMVEQYVPIVLNYLGDEGASSGLLSSLTSLWK
ncbi:DUF2780 domain-containing protein [Vibrio sp.]|uniref:DUF2780 domain-containing protein n=1 Tax=Vibrio sp. TaxID=678 RepID=UPI003AA7D97C